MAPEDEEQNDDGSVLSPEELDITDDENVEEIEDGRYVISPGEASEDTDDLAADAHETLEDPEPAELSGKLTEPEVHEWLREHVGGIDARYGFSVTAAFGGTVHQEELFSNDVATTFENLLTWFARHAGDDTPVEEVLGILLMESNIPVRYPVETLRYLVAKNDLDPEDSIADLFGALGDDLRFPP